MSEKERILVEARELGARCNVEVENLCLTPDEAQQISEDLQILTNPIRLQILDLLASNEGKVCVCDLEESLPIKQPTISHHLRLLKEAGLVAVERHGLWAYYFIQREELEKRRARLSELLQVLV